MARNSCHAPQGPSALLAALVASGLATTSVLFAGFLPPKTTARKRRLAALGASASTVVFYVPPHKLVSTLEVRLGTSHAGLEPLCFGAGLSFPGPCSA